MNWFLIIGGVAFVGLVVLFLWRFFSDPKKVAGLIAIVSSEAFKLAIAELLKPETPEARKARQEAEHRDEVVPTKQRPHPNEGGHR